MAMETSGKEEEELEGQTHEMAGIPIVPSDLKTKKPGLIFVLERALWKLLKLERCSYQILNSDDHANFLRKNNKNPADYRPDIVYQALLSILDSPVNKAGRLRAVYVKTDKGVLFEVKPHVRIPRTYKRFAGIMLQLLQKLSITAVGKREKLLRVIKNPVTQYLPVNSRKIGFSYSSEKLVKMNKYVAAVSDDVDIVFVVGAMAHGKIDCDYIDDFIANSPVNKAGRLRAVYVKTDKGVLFEVKPHVRIPRTYKRFAGIMLQLLQKLSITAVGKREKLLRVIKNPVTQYLPVNSRKIGFSYSSEKLVKMNKYVAAVGDDVDIVFVVGATAHVKIDCDYIDDFIANPSLIHQDLAVLKAMDQKLT
ncbi:hypothetical protein GH714_032749 [Hevea brasiliensis]|uniref:Uncharacterized protein n=1 Tax=Hevea brasiliensis TaxID=3981 RepID=A0A6A6LPQ1_HEVBR|nr:hypothetical protein GH714_032749 [Hevea brasiliensis]